MSTRKPLTDLGTHRVTNQPSPLENFNAFDTDRALQEGLKREAHNHGEDRARRLGEEVGSEQTIHAGHLANQYPPSLHCFDRFGQRIDEVEYHPAYHEMMHLGFGHEIHSIPWQDEGEAGHVIHAAMIYLLTQAEAGVCCPLAMACAAVPSLRRQPDLASEWLPGILSAQYDSRSIPADEKKGLTIGMAMTEKQGGSDVRSNTSTAVPVAIRGPGKEYLLTGHKWFCSAPMSDAFLTLAQTGNGLSCFLVPRWLPDGSRNRFYIQRLKDKLGNRSNASAEIEFNDTLGFLVDGEGKGVRTIIEMVDHTRLAAAASGAGLMRAALAQAIHHAGQRKAFGKLLIDQPLMKNVLADLALEVEAATALFLRIARGYDNSRSEVAAGLFRRIGTAVTKYWINKRTPVVVSEALECLGGAGFVEESLLPRLYREAPLNGIWEGSGNVVCLDVLRTLNKEPDSADAFLAEIETARGIDNRVDSCVESIKRILVSLTVDEQSARRIVEKMALCLQAVLLIQYAPPEIADAFCATRLGKDWGHAFGTIPSGLPLNDIVERANPDRL
ncbi:MAG: acyl-CoA dehydrogenase family protein [Methylococcales bacterium]